jgi:hypothetical protein
MTEIEIPTIILPRDPSHELVKVLTHATVEKRDDRYDEYVAGLKAKGLPLHEVYAKAEKDIKPYEVVVGDYNAMVDNGIQIAIDLLTAYGGATSFATGNARLGVGDSATAWNTTQADLVAATNKLRKVMQSGTYPQNGTKKTTFKSDFTTGEANWVWNEWGIFNSASGVTMLSRKVENLGTKASGTWTLTVEFSLV